MLLPLLSDNYYGHIGMIIKKNNKYKIKYKNNKIKLSYYLHNIILYFNYGFYC